MPGVARDSAAPRREVRHAFVRFVLLNLLAVGLVAAGAIAWSIHVAESQAVRRATEDARSLAIGVIAPLCTAQLSTGNPAAVRALDDAVRGQELTGRVLRVKIWTRTGRIIYSDAPALIGQTFDLSSGDVALLDAAGSASEISQLDKPENVLEASTSPRMVESYVSIRDTRGEPLLFEAYFSADRVDADARAIAWDLTPVALATIIMLQLLQLPLALVLARRLDRAHTERARLLERAVVASEVERRRVAQDLHDGVVQDLAGVGYLLDSVQGLIEQAHPRVRDAVGRATEIVQQDVRTLRQTMVDLNPFDVVQSDLASAIADLTVPLRDRGVRCQVRIAETDSLPELDVRLLYQAAREALRNVAKHAHAHEVTVTVTVRGRQAELTVSDDGVGFSPSNTPKGHFGLRLLEQSVADSGGELTVFSELGLGTTVRVVTAG